MFSLIKSATVYGMDSYIINVETDVSPGLPGFEMVGLLNSEVKEAKERVKVSLKNSGFVLPVAKITVNLSPANIRKNGTKYDLPIAISLLVAVGEIEQYKVDNTLLLGELGLDGELRFAEGVLPIVLKAREEGIKRVILPKANIKEASVVNDIKIYGMDNLIDVVRFLNDQCSENFKSEGFDFDEYYNNSIAKLNADFSDVCGQMELKRASMVSAAGFHNMLMIGSPGSGKSLIAKRFPSILPSLSYEESLEVSKIYSIAGEIKEGESLVVERPFIAPHHTSSCQSLVGGGNIPKPGLISLAHRGVLFLDEAVHFQTNVLEALRQPLEDKYITISRSSGKFKYPADFMLLVAVNPCPCGYYPDRNKCRCSEKQINNYLSKISGPILDRIDICVSSATIEYNDLKSDGDNLSSEEMRKRIEVALLRQEYRFYESNIRFNSEMGVSDLKEYCQLDPNDEYFLEASYKKLGISARGYHKILKTARTIADLDNKDRIMKKHLAEAINYRIVRNRFW